VLGYTAYTFALGAFGVLGADVSSARARLAVDQAATFFAQCSCRRTRGHVESGVRSDRVQKRNHAGYAVDLDSRAGRVPLAFGAFLAGSTFGPCHFWRRRCSSVPVPGPVNTLILETAPVNLRASAMAVPFSRSISSATCVAGDSSAGWQIHSAEICRKAVLILPLALIWPARFGLVLALKRNGFIHLRDG